MKGNRSKSTHSNM